MRTGAALRAALLLGTGASETGAHPAKGETGCRGSAAPDFVLTAQDGRRLALADLRGKVVAVTFIDASCADTCPLLTAKLVGFRVTGRIVTSAAGGCDRAGHGCSGPAGSARSSTMRLLAEGKVDAYIDLPPEPQDALATMKEPPYSRWREYDPADTLRYSSLGLHETGLIRATPQKIIAQGTDWRFLNELKRELKG